MDMSAVIEKYGLTLSNVLSDESLHRLIDVYEALVETLKTDEEKAENKTKTVTERIRKSFSDDSLNGISKEIRQGIAELLNIDPDYSILLVDLLQTIKQDVMTFRDFHVASIIRSEKPERVKDDAEASVRKMEAETLRDTINSVWTLMGQPKKGYKIKTVEKTGNQLLDLSRIGGGNSTANVGKGAVVRSLVFRLDGDMMPTGTLFYDVIQNHLNDFANGSVYKVQDVKAMIEEAGFNFAPKGEANRWTIVINGHSFEGWVPED